MAHDERTDDDTSGGGVCLSRRGLIRGLAAGSLLATGASAAGEGGADRATVANENLRVRVDGTTGQFRLSDADGVSLLYPGDTSGMAVRVDGTVYRTWCAMREFLTDGPTVVDGGAAVRAVWRLPSVTVERELRLEGESVAFDLTLENRDDRSHGVDVQYLLDYQVGDGGTTPVDVGGTRTTSATRFTDPSFTAWTLYDSYPDPHLTAHQTVDDRVDSVAFLDWETAARSVTRDGVRGGPYAGTPTDESGGTLSDTAAVVGWDLGPLPADARRTVSMTVGVGPVPAGVGDPTGVVAESDLNGDGEISLAELARAARAYANGEYTLRELSAVAQAYAGSA